MSDAETATPAAPAAPGAPAAAPGDFLSPVKFSTLPLSRETQRALSHRLRLDCATRVQAAALPAALAGSDVACRARTGSGKTLAFVIPAAELVLRHRGSGAEATIADAAPTAVVVAPTRELAAQIGEVARAVLAYQPGARAVVVTGGADAEEERAELRAYPPHVLVATPGRLLDHLRSAESGLARSVRRAPLRLLVLDEADRMLDAGFREDVDAVLAMMPPRDERQTLLFSATFPPDIERLAAEVLRPGYQIVDLVDSADATPPAAIKQAYAATPVEQQAACAVAAIDEEAAAGGKTLAFFSTARIAALYAGLWRALGREAAFEIHSRMSQAKRNEAFMAFRAAGPGAVMFSSDVSARGVDYPDVTLVLQVGMPPDRRQYVHRVGRTARAWKSGRALMLLADYEREACLALLTELPLEEAGAPESAHAVAEEVAAAMQRVGEEDKAMAYLSWLGVMQSLKEKLHWSRDEIVRRGLEYARVIGLREVPKLGHNAARAMGLLGAKGLPVYEEGSYYEHGVHMKRKKLQERSKDAGAAADDQGADEAPKKKKKAVAAEDEGEEQQPEKKRKKKSADTDAAVEGEEEAPAETPKKRKRKTTDDEAEVQEDEAPKKRSKKAPADDDKEPRKKKKSADADMETEQQEQEAPKKRTKKASAQAEEEPEETQQKAAREEAAEDGAEPPKKKARRKDDADQNESAEKETKDSRPRPKAKAKAEPKPKGNPEFPGMTKTQRRRLLRKQKKSDRIAAEKAAQESQGDAPTGGSAERRPKWPIEEYDD
eukprot:m51a1_g11365 putative protein (776) ;mRNA; r:9353-11680